MIEELLACCVRLDRELQLGVYGRHAHIDMLRRHRQWVRSANSTNRLQDERSGICSCSKYLKRLIQRPITSPLFLLWNKCERFMHPSATFLFLQSLSDLTRNALCRSTWIKRVPTTRYRTLFRWEESFGIQLWRLFTVSTRCKDVEMKCNSSFLFKKIVFGTTLSKIELLICAHSPNASATKFSNDCNQWWNFCHFSVSVSVWSLTFISVPHPYDFQEFICVSVWLSGVYFRIRMTFRRLFPYSYDSQAFICVSVPANIRIRKTVFL